MYAVRLLTTGASALISIPKRYLKVNGYPAINGYHIEDNEKRTIPSIWEACAFLQLIMRDRCSPVH